jgi:EipB-like
MNLAFGGQDNITNEHFFQSWESYTSRNYNFSVLTLQNGNIIEDYSGIASLNTRGGSATYKLPPAEGSKVNQSIYLKLPAGTLFPVAYEQALLASAEDGKSLFRRMVLDGASSWPVSAAYFNMNRDMPNTEIFMQFFNSGVA